MVITTLIAVAQYEEMHPTARTGGDGRNRPALHRQYLEALLMAFPPFANQLRAYNSKQCTRILHTNAPTPMGASPSHMK